MRKAILTSIFICTVFCLQAQHALQLESRPFSITGKIDEDNLFALSLGPETGMILGMVQELYYGDPDNNGDFDFMVSRLDWQQYPLFYIGGSGSINFLSRFFLGFGIWFGMPALIGFMEDRDWDETTGDYIIFSHHDNFLENALFIDSNAGYSLFSSDILVINALIGFNLKQIHMSGQNGWQERYDGGLPGGPYTGEVINYEFNIFSPYIGLETAWTPFTWLSMDAFLSVSPFLTFAYNRDFHQGFPGTNFQDLPAFGFTFSGLINMEIHLGLGFDLKIKNSFEWAPPFQGLTYTNGFRQINRRGGSSFILYNLSVSVNWGFELTTPPAPVAPPDDQLRLPR